MKGLISNVKLYRYVGHFRAVESKFWCRGFSYKLTRTHLEECGDKEDTQLSACKN